MFYLFTVYCNLMLNFISADNEIWGKLTLSINTISGVSAASPDQNNNFIQIQSGFVVLGTKQKIPRFFVSKFVIHAGMSAKYSSCLQVCSVKLDNGKIIRLLCLPFTHCFVATPSSYSCSVYPGCAPWCERIKNFAGPMNSKYPG